MDSTGWGLCIWHSGACMQCIHTPLTLNHRPVGFSGNQFLFLKANGTPLLLLEDLYFKNAHPKSPLLPSLYDSRGSESHNHAVNWERIQGFCPSQELAT